MLSNGKGTTKRHEGTRSRERQNANHLESIMPDLLYKDEMYAIIGDAMDVHNELGPGFLEAVCQEALEIEFLSRKLPHYPQRELRVFYKGQMLNKFYIADFSCYDGIMVEIKAQKQLTEI